MNEQLNSGNLPAGWSLSDGGRWLTGRYEREDWAVEIAADLLAPRTGPSSIRIDYDGQESDGITLDVLRAVPLGEARRILADLVPKLRAAVAPERAPAKLPERVQDERDHALVAKAYVDLLAAGERRPIQVLADSAGISRNTVSARVRRAREAGLLDQTGTGAKLTAQLTAKAVELLNEG